MPRHLRADRKAVPRAQWLLIAPIRGYLDGALIIAFLILIGGAFSVIQATGTIEFAIRRITVALTAHPRLEKLMIPVLVTIFSLAGSVFGMAEEVIPFVLVFVPLALSLGYDSIVGVAIPFLGAAAGFGAAFFNPFTVGVAQGLVGLPLYSGLGYRLFTWLLTTGVMIGWIVVYAARVRRSPALSPVGELEPGAGSGRSAGRRAERGPRGGWPCPISSAAWWSCWGSSRRRGFSRRSGRSRWPWGRDGAPRG